MKIKPKKIFTVSLVSAVLVIAGLVSAYKWGIPALVNSPYTSNIIEKEGKKFLGADIKIDNMKLKTGIEVAFTVDKFIIDKDGKNYLTLSDIDTLFSLKELYKKNIIVKY